MAKKKYTEYKDSWNREKYDSFLLRLPKGALDKVRASAEEEGLSVQAWLNRTVLGVLGGGDDEKGGDD